MNHDASAVLGITPRWARALRVVAAASLGAALLALPGAALAQKKPADAADTAEKPKKIGVYVEGFQAGKVRQDILATLPDGVEVANDFEFKSAMIKSGRQLPIGGVLAMEDAREASIGRIRAALEKIGADGAILGLIRKRPTGGGVEVYLVFVPAAADEVLPVDGATPLTLKDDKQAIGSALVPGYALLDSGPEKIEPEEVEPEEAPPEEEEEKPKEEEEEPEEEGPDRKTGAYGAELFSIAVSFELAGRFFSYNDIYSNNLRDYDVFGVPSLFVGAEIYPLADSGTPIAEDLGVVGHFAQAFALDSETSDGTVVGTSWNRFDVGLRFRLNLGDRGDAPVLGLTGGFSRMDFSFDAPAPLSEEVPAVTYSSLFVGLDGRVPVGPVAIGAGAKYLGALGAGDTKDRFTDPSIGGVSFGLGVAVPIAMGLEGRFWTEYQRWFYAFKPEVGDPFVAGGALDQYLFLQLGLGFLY
jgi:hypothetical protein